ncbi:CRTAC1 family protein [Muriicola sp. Z0-33]|uniref:CRTAC1 family protein n=1 Tax=Muriicola sp. Z0-33 TaxID=2816957 RepID=UPI00223783FF|nr:CRTAC1 family protein [Muriicola sp. Z0-33]MCW5516451.1 CRTAC1 family protein [Muriicola sp. Z0-33]
MKPTTHNLFSAVLFQLIVAVSFGQATFTDITSEAGIEHQFHVYEGTFGGGATVFDINNDGYEDLFITSGTQSDVLYLNNGDGTFKNIYETSGLNVSKGYVTQGAVSADVNKDGFKDLFITTINTTDGKNTIPRATNLFFLNNGDLTFRDVTAEYKLDHLNSFSTGASFGDVNADGYPDLYIGNYFLEFEGTLGILKDATIVSAHQTARGYLLINKNGEYFENEYEDYNLEHRGFGFGALFTDFDNDADQDLLVNHDFGYKAVPNFLYENRYPRSSFDDISKATEMDLKENAMGSAVGDYNNDGLLDYYVTNIKFNLLMENNGVGKPFVDRAKELGTYNFAISWGANFADFDHDMDLDLYVSNGDLNPNCTPMGNFYFENSNARFTDESRATATNDYGVGRGSVVFDIENDGDLDLLVVNQKPVREYPTQSTTRLFRNDVTTGNWLKVALQGTSSEKNGIGSRVEVVVGDTKMIREIDGGGSSHLSQNSTIAHFGLGTAKQVDSVIVTWIGGKQQLLLNQNANQLITINEIPDKPSKLPYVASIVVFLGLIIIYLKRRRKRTPDLS